MGSLAQAYPMEQARIRAAVQAGREIGPSGAFYVAAGEALLREAEVAAMSGDITRMLLAYHHMTEFKV